MLTHMTPARTSATDPDAGIISGIEPSDLRGEYAQRGIDEWPDARLAAAVADIVSVPRRGRSNSFVLHAPLELAARAALLPRVAPPHRELARLHLLAVAVQYEAFGPPLGVPATKDLTVNDPAARVAEAIAAADEEESVRAARALAVEPPSEIIRCLTDVVAPLTAAAGHAPIFLYHLDRGGLRNGPSRPLLVPLIRELARQPEWRIGWIDEPRSLPYTDADALAERLASAPILGPPENTFIHPLMMQVDSTGFAASVLADTVGSYSDDAARAILRTAARSMLFENCDHAPYGWTHCLTMPQALLGLAGHASQPDRLLALAATEVVAFRTALGGATIPTTTPSDISPVDPDALASTAATSHDAHVVKYVLACLDAAAWDPDEASLYLAAGQRLLDCWAARGGDPTDPLG